MIDWKEVWCFYRSDSRYKLLNTYYRAETPVLVGCPVSLQRIENAFSVKNNWFWRKKKGVRPSQFLVDEVRSQPTETEPGVLVIRKIA